MSTTIADLIPGQWTDLISPLEDERIRMVEKEFLQKQEDDRITVKLEGKGDVRFFKRFGENEKHKYQRIGISKGKNELIEHVKEFSSDLGVVDMDHDFRGADIGLYSLPKPSFSDRIADTRGSCCLFDVAIGGNLVTAATMLIRRLCDNSGNSRVIESQLRGRQKEFVSLVRELTAARLFKGHSGDKNPSTQPKFTWSEIGDLEFCTSHLITDKRVSEFSDFKRKYSSELDNAGFNDHAFADSLKSLLREYFDEHEMPSDGTINYHITTIMLKLGKKSYIQPILTKLRNYESPQ